MIEITSVWSFAFIFLIVCIGYVFIAINGKHYWFNKKNNQNDNAFERWLQYLIWWLFINLIYLYISLQIDSELTHLANQLNNAGSVWEALAINGNGLIIQMFTFTVFYFAELALWTILSSVVSRGITRWIKKRIKSRKKSK